jgi:predicted glycosyltransferase
MNILIDIGHPAHVHLFRNLYNELCNDGHTVIVTVREIPAAMRLLDLFQIPYKSLGGKGASVLTKGFNQLKFLYNIYRIARKNKIEIAIGSSITIAHLSVISNIVSIVTDDDDDAVQPLMVKFGHPFATLLLSPSSLTGMRRRKDTLYYPGYHELAYLSPGRFNPDLSVLKEAGIEEGEKYFLMRFNAFKAHHDVGIKGLSLNQKIILAKYLEQYGKVFITSEKEIEPELEIYRLPVSPHKIHSLLAFATLFIGDSQTMTSEAAVLGIPSLRCNSFAGRIAYLEEQEKKYNLTFCFKPEEFELLMEKLKEILHDSFSSQKYSMLRSKMLNEKIDVTTFLKWLIEYYPSSVSSIRSERNVFERFSLFKFDKNN